MLNEYFLLIVEILPDALGNGNNRPLQFQDTESNTVDIKDNIGALRVRRSIRPGNRNLFGNSKVVLLRVLPVDQPNVLRVLANIWLYFDGVPQEIIDNTIPVVEALAGISRIPFEEEQSTVDNIVVIPALLQVTSQQTGLDVAVADSIFQVSQAIVMKPVTEEGDYPILGQTLALSNVVCHVSLVLPVSSSCITPCLSSRVFVS